MQGNTGVVLGKCQQVVIAAVYGNDGAVKTVGAVEDMAEELRKRGY